MITLLNSLASFSNIWPLFPSEKPLSSFGTQDITTFWFSYCFQITGSSTSGYISATQDSVLFFLFFSYSLSLGVLSHMHGFNNQPDASDLQMCITIPFLTFASNSFFNISTRCLKRTFMQWVQKLTSDFCPLNLPLSSIPLFSNEHHYPFAQFKNLRVIFIYPVVSLPPS